MRDSVIVRDKKINRSAPLFNSTRSQHKTQASQFSLLLDPPTQAEAIATIEPAGYWPDRWVIQIKDCDLIWCLVPCLRRSEAEEILATLRLLEVDLRLDQNEGLPIAIKRINEIPRLYLDRASRQGGTV